MNNKSTLNLHIFLLKQTQANKAFSYKVPTVDVSLDEIGGDWYLIEYVNRFEHMSSRIFYLYSKELKSLSDNKNLQILANSWFIIHISIWKALQTKFDTVVEWIILIHKSILIPISLTHEPFGWFYF